MEKTVSIIHLYEDRSVIYSFVINKTLNMSNENGYYHISINIHIEICQRVKRKMISNLYNMGEKVEFNHIYGDRPISLFLSPKNKSE